METLIPQRKQTFLDRNRRRSLLALLLLFFRRRKQLVLVLLVLVPAGLIVADSVPFRMLEGWAGRTLLRYPLVRRGAQDLRGMLARLGIDFDAWNEGPRDLTSLALAFRQARSRTNLFWFNRSVP